MTRAWFAIALAVAPLLAACLGTSPEESARRALGRDESGEHPSPEHRAGQPCLTCHGDHSDSVDPQFAIAGTVYEYITDTTGMEGVEVVIDDAAGHNFRAITNSVGNFMVNVDPSLAGATEFSRGWVGVPFEPVFPLRVAVVGRNGMEIMRSNIYREGSCAACHTSDVNARSAGRVFLSNGGT